MDDTKKLNILNDIARGIIARHNLSDDEVLRLADLLDPPIDAGSVSKAPLSGLHQEETFDSLMIQLLDQDIPVPSWVTSPDDPKLDSFSQSEFSAIKDVLKLRFWYTETQNRYQLFHLWNLVFAIPLQPQRHLSSITNDNIPPQDLRALKNLQHPLGGPRFVELLPPTNTHRYLEDFGTGYMALRDAYFPENGGGMEHILDGFSRHYREVSQGVRRLTRCQDRVVALQQAGDSPTENKLLAASESLCANAREALSSALDRARRWKKTELAQRERLSLPGVLQGLRYGKDVYCKEDTPQQQPMIVVGGRTFDYRHSPVRFTPGTTWGDFFHNHYRGDSLPNMREPWKNDATRVPGGGREEDMRQPMIYLPLGAAPILKHFRGLYEEERGKQGPQPDLDYLEVFRQGKKLSLSTGLDYWNVGEGFWFEIDDLNTQFVNHAEATKQTRPIYDAAGNLRYDFMAAILNEILTGNPPQMSPRQQESLELRRYPPGFDMS